MANKSINLRRFIVAAPVFTQERFIPANPETNRLMLPTFDVDAAPPAGSLLAYSPEINEHYSEIIKTIIENLFR